jgi:hypothetical protein
VDDELLLLYLAMIGFFGLTSNEKMYVGYSNYNYNYPYGGTGVNSVSSAPKMTFKSPPKVSSGTTAALLKSWFHF